MAKERPPLEEMTLRQLRRVASQKNVPRYSRMRKSELLAAIQEKEPVQSSTETQTVLEGAVKETKFDLGQEDRSGGPLATVDDGLSDLPQGYGESRIVLLPRDPQWAYAYWDVPNEHRQELRQQGGQQLALRVYDTTGIDLNSRKAHNVQEYLCDELAREWYLPIPVSDREYVIDIGYRCPDGRWLVLARSAPVTIPPAYPSDWVDDQFITIDWEESLVGKTFLELTPPTAAAASTEDPDVIYQEMFALAQGVEAQRVAGSLYGSMQQSGAPSSFSMMASQVLSSYVFPSGVGLWALPTLSGASMSGVGMGVRPQPRKFWLVADAELIVYGATEPDATVTVAGQPITLNSDGTFRFHVAFPDGELDYPIMAVAVDGEQTRSIHMHFERQTPARHTNTKEEAVLEWP